MAPVDRIFWKNTVIIFMVVDFPAAYKVYLRDMFNNYNNDNNDNYLFLD